MSSITWTPAALSSSAQFLAGRCWRAVEAQHHVSTAKLTDTGAEQLRLEELLEDSKPAVPEECRHLHFLLSTPFRYGAPYPHGSRFRRAGLTAGVFYASQLVETAMAELAFHRMLFFAESPSTPWPANAGEYTIFAVDYATGRAIDLTVAPFKSHHARWTHPTDYAACQNLADSAHAAGVEVLKYHSARDPAGGGNLALLSCRAFAGTEAIGRQTWRIHLSPSGARAICEFPKLGLDFDRAAFASDPRIAGMNWDR